MTARNDRVAFLFDQDGVLLDTAAFVRDNWRRFAAAHGLTLRDADLPRIYGRRTIDILVDVFGIPPSDALVMASAWVDARRAIPRRPPIGLVPGAPDFVRMSVAAGIATALVSSAAANDVRYALELTDLTDAFDAVVTAADVRQGKPEADPYRTGAQRLGVDPASTVVFEDSPAGIAAGLAAGARVVALATTFAHDRAALAGADLVIDDFDGLVPDDLLARLGGSVSA